jgi:hypothetical protein
MFAGESSRAYTRGEAWLMVAKAASARALTWKPMMYDGSNSKEDMKGRYDSV